MTALGLLTRFGLTKPSGGPPPAGISYVGVTTDRQAGSSAIRNVDKPPGTIEGDLILVLFGGTDSSYLSDLTPPSGWTQLERVTYTPTSGDGFRMALFAKTAGASEPSTYAFSTNANNAAMQWVGVAYRGAKIADSSSTFHTSSASTSDTPPVDVPPGGVWAGGWSSHLNRDLTPEAGLSARVSGVNRIAWADQPLPSGAASVTRQAALSSSGRNAAFGVALEPA